MRITADSVQPTDHIRGIDLVVEYAEPETDHTTRLSGVVTTRDEDGDRYEFSTSIVVPNEHVVDVAMTDERFLALQHAGLHAIRVAYSSDPTDPWGTAASLDRLIARDRNSFESTHFTEGGSTTTFVLDLLSNPEFTDEEVYAFVARDLPSARILGAAASLF